jgi:alkanesulfonate monooxygenase SsuD/methylene tetrahydromethanopterin reductase-like flavin-dependent oxidoreductase (luciferase family)
MRFFHFSEQPYPDAWKFGLESLRNTIPNSYCDPKIAHRIYNERLTEYESCDELGLNVAFNEHHSSATCLSESPTLHAAIVARTTKKARILPLGIPIALRPDPVRVAEEIAMIDCISGGRLEVGLVKASPFEISPNNANPTRYMDRFWEAHDLILKALAARDGPFNFEGEFHHYRQVNIWPQPYQQPHPPVWITAGSPESTLEIATRGHNLAVFLAGRNLKKLMDLYRQRTRELGRPEAGPEKFGYLCLVGVGRTEEEGHRRAHAIQGYLRTTTIVGEAFMNPPGYMSIEGNMKWLRLGINRGRAGNHFAAAKKDGTVINQGTASIPDLIDANIVFAGTPDQVYDQFCEFNDYVGGVGTFVTMLHGGELGHAKTLDNIRLFGEKVAPRLDERYPTAPAIPIAAE